MSNYKMNLDRPNLSSEEINGRQNFEEVLSKFKASSPSFWKSPWFWGPTGLATVGIAVFLSLNSVNSQNVTHEEKITLAKNELPNDTECLHPPVEKEKVAFENYEVDPQKNEQLVLSSGTVISFEKGSLQPENLNRKVQISVRELNDKSTVFLAGVPMDYQENDAFISAGMLEIRGTQQGKEVAINSMIPVKVDMKLTKDGSSFDFWKLNETKKAWEKYPSSTPKKQLSKKEFTTDSVVIKPVKANAKMAAEIAKLDSKIEKCNQSMEKLVKPSVVAYKIPEANHQKFDLEFNKSTYPELAKFENLVFEIIPTNGYDKNFTKKTWSEVKLDKANGNYEMIFIGNSEKMKVAVRPVLQGNELKEAQKNFDKAMQEFSTQLQKIETEKKQFETQKAEYRAKIESELDNRLRTTRPALETANVNDIVSFAFTSWGIFNSDKPSPYPAAAQQEVAMVWKSGYDVAPFQRIFVFNLKKDIRYDYGKNARHNLQEFGLDKKGDLVIIGLLDDGTAGIAELKDNSDRMVLKKIVFSKQQKGESLKEILKHLFDETNITS